MPLPPVRVGGGPGRRRVVRHADVHVACASALRPAPRRARSRWRPARARARSRVATTFVLLFTPRRNSPDRAPRSQPDDGPSDGNVRPGLAVRVQTSPQARAVPHRPDGRRRWAPPMPELRRVETDVTGSRPGKSTSTATRFVYRIAEQPGPPGGARARDGQLLAALAPGRDAPRRSATPGDRAGSGRAQAARRPRAGDYSLRSAREPSSVDQLVGARSRPRDGRRALLRRRRPADGLRLAVPAPGGAATWAGLARRRSGPRKSAAAAPRSRCPAPPR